MGLIIAFACIAGLIISAVLILLSIVLWRHVSKRYNRGSWKIYIILYILALTSLFWSGTQQFPSGHDGPPTGDDFFQVMLALFIYGIALGIASVAGLSALFYKRPLIKYPKMG